MGLNCLNKKRDALGERASLAVYSIDQSTTSRALAQVTSLSVLRAKGSGSVSVEVGTKLFL